MPTITNKLYPPIIGTRIPAFQQDYEDNLFITVPFENNRAVSRSDIITIALKLKTITNDYRTINGYAYVEEGQSLEDAITNAWNNGVVTFKLTPDQYQTDDGWFLNVGQYYKIQLAYVHIFTPAGAEPTVEEYAANIGYYSEVGISKFSWYPNVYIDGLNSSERNPHIYQYFGRYEQTYDTGESDESAVGIADSTEKVYNYRFVITNTLNGIVKDSGWLLHDASTDDVEYASQDSWEQLNELPTTGENKIQYQVRTNSGIEANSEEYILTNEMDEEDICNIEGRLDFDNGYVSIVATDYDEESGTTSIPYWLRIDQETGERVKIGKMIEGEPFKDFIVEQGKTYTYKIIIDDTISEKYYQVKVDFEDMFLYDGARQLKVRFNPTMSGIHRTIMETKTDTIGSKYPFFFRNGDVNYRDCTIGGLISFHMDEQKLFSSLGGVEEYERGRTYTPMPEGLEDFSLPTDLTGTNFTHERKFRDEVFDWLNNGELKLFRSPAEGIMLVRLMGVNLSPDQTTSRMIYSFSCQAYEADGHDYEDLVKNKIINLS